MRASAIAAWHDGLASRNLDHLRAWLAEEASFRPPVMHTPQRGKPLTALYLTAALSRRRGL
jgi:hypothetical protein